MFLRFFNIVFTLFFIVSTFFSPVIAVTSLSIVVLWYSASNCVYDGHSDSCTQLSRGVVAADNDDDDEC